MLSTTNRRGRSAQRPAALIAAAVVLSAAACAPDTSGGDPAIAVEDPTGRTVSLDAPARRVVSMLPGVTEWILAMDGGDRLVARTDYDTQPSLDTLPSVGGGLTPSIEWLAARHPDLVVAWPDAPSRSIVGRLGQLAIPVYAAPIESVEQSFRVAEDLGTLLGVTADADTAIASVRRGLDDVRRAVAYADRPDVLFLIGLDPLMAAGPGTFVDELIGVAGGRNVLDDLGVLWPQLSMEEVVRRAPDVVIVGSAHTDDPAALLAGRAGWRDVPAVRNGAVHPVDPNLVNRPGPHLHEAAALLARLIHGASPTRAAR